MYIDQVRNEFEFDCEANDLLELKEMIDWIGENCTGGRVHFSFDGGVLTNKQNLCWIRGRIKFTNDVDGSDLAAFKLRWL